MKTTTDFWRDWWNRSAKRNSEDSEVDRGTTIHICELERRADRQFLDAVDPQSTDLILDAGCGTGVNLSKLSDLVAGIVGIDFSEEMIKRAERRIDEEQITNVRLLLGDITQLEFSSGTFDKVICTSVLQYLNDDECKAALGEMMRVCKSKAIMVIHLKNGRSLYGLSRKLLHFIAKIIRKRITPDHYRSRVWYERVICSLGGTIVDYDSFGIFTLVKLPQKMVRYLLDLEMKLLKGKGFKRFGVNYKMTVRIN